MKKVNDKSKIKEIKKKTFINSKIVEGVIITILGTDTLQGNG